GDWVLPVVKVEPIMDGKEEPILMAPYIDLILISILVHGRQVGRVLLDGGAACDVIYEHYFLKLQKDIKERRRDVYTTLSGFSSEQVSPLGEITLQIIVGEASHHRSEEITFLIAWSDFPNNIVRIKSLHEVTAADPPD
nr:reverse transcriptase domain-containing protein [Tanacetum cinerariifolium]